MDLRNLFNNPQIGDEVVVEGWIRNHRKQKEFGFIDFSDGTTQQHLQIVYDNELSNLSPAGTFIDFSGSPLIPIVTSPLLTIKRLEIKINVTNTITIAINRATPQIIVLIVTPYNWMPEKDIKPKPIKPAVINTMPKPFKPAGKWAYFNFSLTAANKINAIAQETPEPKPYTIDSVKL